MLQAYFLYLSFQNETTLVHMANPVFSKKVIDRFGYDVYQYRDEKGEIGIDILPEKGLIVDIILLGVSLLQGPSSKDDFEHNASYKSSILAPFPNRLKEGKYTFQDKTYQFPINDTTFNNALHGIRTEGGFELVKEEAGSSLNLSMQSEYLGDKAYFPFPYSIRLDISIDSFKCQMGFEIQNIGSTDAPLGIGWHPYFTLGKPIDECGLCIPKCKKIELDDALIPTGKASPFKEYTKCKPLKETHFNNAFVIEKDTDFTSVVLESETHKLRYYQETKPDKFNYLQIYTPEDRQSIAFEPMSCNIDAHNNLKGLHILKPGKKFRARCGVALQKK